MKKKVQLFLMTALCNINVMAYDIAVRNADRVTIYYNYINEGKELEVTKGDYYFTNSVVIPDEVAFMDQTLSVTSIGDSAFYDCSSLKSATIPESVTSIGNSAFNGCWHLTSVAIPESVTSIGDHAFAYCGDLTSLTIPEHVTCIKDGTFYECEALTSITIPSNVTSIGEYAFLHCSGLTSVIIPGSVKNIGHSAFSRCSGLTSVTIGIGVTSIGSSAFSYCSGLTSMVVESSNPNYDSREDCNAIIETISNKLIAGCQNTTIPGSVTSIGEGAFEACSSLTSVTIPKSVTSIEKSAFSGCSHLTSVIIPESVTSVGDYTFSGCSGLTSVIIPESLKHIGSDAFRDCSHLTTVTIGRGLTSIGNRAFSGCNLKTVISLIEEPFQISNGTFNQFTLDYATLHIPNGTIDKYKGTEGWRDFKNIEELEATKVTEMEATPLLIKSDGSTISIQGAPAGTPISVYDLSGKKLGLAVAAEGPTRIICGGKRGKVMIVKVGKQSVKVMSGRKNGDLERVTGLSGDR